MYDPTQTHSSEEIQGAMRDADLAFPIYEDAASDTACLKRAFRELFMTIWLEVPASRTRSLALTALEEAGMWAVKAIHQGRTR